MVCEVCESREEPPHVGQTILSFIERLSSLRRLKCTSIIEKGPQNVSFIESFSIVFFTWSVHHQRFHCRDLKWAVGST